MSEYVWLFWVNDAVEHVYAEEADALKAMTAFMQEESRKDRDIAWRPLNVHRWTGSRFARVEVSQRKVR